MRTARLLTHIWITACECEAYHLKKLHANEFIGIRNGAQPWKHHWEISSASTCEYHKWESELLSVGSDKPELLFSHAFQKHARITVSNKVSKSGCVLFQSRLPRSLTASSFRTLSFHAQFRQGQPKHGWTPTEEQWRPTRSTAKTNLDGKAIRLGGRNGPRTFRGSTMSVFARIRMAGGVRVTTCFSLMANARPSINPGRARRLFPGRWDFGRPSFFLSLYGAPVVREERAGGKSSVYRLLHMDHQLRLQSRSRRQH